MKIIPLLLVLFPLAGNAAAVRHQLNASINPAQGSLAAADTLTFQAPSAEFVFTLHKGLNPAVKQPGAVIEEIDAAAAARYGINGATSAVLSAYRVKLARPARTFTLEYSGVIAHPPAEQAQEYARSFSETPGIISEKGCYLSGSSGWYPGFGGALVTYRLQTRLPAPYNAVAGGARTMRALVNGENFSTWEETKPQDDITLACAAYHEYSLPGRPALYAFLLTPDADLAARYLTAAGKYIPFYTALLGPYPYAKFALVENFWETGYGIPSFTLLGSKVLRLPFIINTSYPHEILHNWWGNGVFVDYEKGNWCEGLTAYLADYLIAENRGRGLEYRATTLKNYAAYAAEEKDFPLTEFRARHSSASEAVGYGKALMFYHMLRQALGDANFKAGLRAFYAANLGRAASFSDLRAAFGKQTGPGRLAGFFAQWLNRAGAPELALKGVSVSRPFEEYNLEFTLTQRQDGPPYRLKVPILVYLEDVPEPRRKVLDLTKKEELFNYAAPLKIRRLEIDPEFDVFRRLSPLETPPALAGLGREEPLPAAARRPRPERLARFRRRLDQGRLQPAAGDPEHRRTGRRLLGAGRGQRPGPRLRTGAGSLRRPLHHRRGDTGQPGIFPRGPHFRFRRLPPRRRGAGRRAGIGPFHRRAQRAGREAAALRQVFLAGVRRRHELGGHRLLARAALAAGGRPHRRTRAGQGYRTAPAAGRAALGLLGRQAAG
ncbi:MAG: M1 family aminopeptidase [Elusimicrobia bacterium]|nr:M1 family aminopeptidase [Elusimicrobiota bacterium]